MHNNDSSGFLRKILIIPEIGEMGHFGVQNKHFWAILQIFSLDAWAIFPDVGIKNWSKVTV